MAPWLRAGLKPGAHLYAPYGRVGVGAPLMAPWLRTGIETWGALMRPLRVGRCRGAINGALVAYGD